MAGKEMALKDSEWSDEQLETGLARLKEMHIMCRQLRHSIPDIVRPLTRRHESPDHLYREYAKAAISSTSDLREFRGFMQSAESKAVLEKAAASEKADSNEIKNWRPMEDKEWYSKQKIQLTERPKENQQSIGSSRKSLDVEAVIARFKKGNPKIKVDWKDNRHELLLQTSGGSPLNFIITINPSTDEGAGLPSTVDCKGSSRAHGAILQSIAEQTQAFDLELTLDMLASYGNLWTTKCDGCGELLDKTALPPTVRRLKPPKSEQDVSNRIWFAFHQNCP